jgi:hypothetical protein
MYSDNLKNIIYKLNSNTRLRQVTIRRLLWRQKILGCCWFHHLSFDIIFFRLSEYTSIHPAQDTQIYELLPVLDVYCCWVYILYFSGCQNKFFAFKVNVWKLCEHGDLESIWHSWLKVVGCLKIVHNFYAYPILPFFSYTIQGLWKQRMQNLNLKMLRLRECLLNYCILFQHVITTTNCIWI